MRREVHYVLLYGVLPFSVVAGLFYSALAERKDYLGHYAAGYGGSLCAAVIVLGLGKSASVRARSYLLAALTVLCIAAGAVAEATVFRLAKFDEIDFFNQSLGAVMAGLVALGMARTERVSDSALRTAVGIGALTMLIGVYFAFA